MYLNRDVADKHVERVQDDSPVHVPPFWARYISDALYEAERFCAKLKEETNPQQSAVDFWCDMVDDLKGIQRDIQLVSEEIK